MPAKDWKVTVAKSAFANPRHFEFEKMEEAVYEANTLRSGSVFEKSGGFVIVSKGQETIQEWRENPQGGHFMFPGDFEHPKH